MKTLKQSFILTGIIVMVSVISYLHGVNKANTATLSDLKFHLNSLVIESKQHGYDSAINNIRSINIEDVKNKL